MKECNPIFCPFLQDETHYFVMTAKKQSLIDKGVIVENHADTQVLLGAENINQEKLFEYAREAADYATDYQMPHLDFAVNHYGKPDVAMFDFTSMFQVCFLALSAFFRPSMFLRLSQISAWKLATISPGMCPCPCEGNLCTVDIFGLCRPLWPLSPFFGLFCCTKIVASNCTQELVGNGMKKLCFTHNIRSTSIATWARM